MDYIAGILEVIAMYMVGNKNKYGFLVAFTGGVLWVTYVLTNGVAYGLLFVTIPAIFINIRNFVKWGNNG